MSQRMQSPRTESERASCLHAESVVQLRLGKTGLTAFWDANKLLWAFTDHRLVCGSCVISPK